MELKKCIAVYGDGYCLDIAYNMESAVRAYPENDIVFKEGYTPDGIIFILEKNKEDYLKSINA